MTYKVEYLQVGQENKRGNQKVTVSANDEIITITHGTNSTEIPRADLQDLIDMLSEMKVVPAKV